MTLYDSSISKKVELTGERKTHIRQHHPDIVIHFTKIEEVLQKPDQIRVDKRDPNILLFYKHFGRIKKYLVVVIKINQRNFILTFYSTYRIKTGEKYEN